MMPIQKPESQRPESQRPGPKRLAIDKKPHAFPLQPLKTKARQSFTTQKKLQVLSYWATPSIPLKWNLVPGTATSGKPLNMTQDVPIKISKKPLVF